MDTKPIKRVEDEEDENPMPKPPPIKK